VLRQDLFAGWSPTGKAFAYGTLDGLFVVGSDGRTRQLASIRLLVRGEPFLNQWGWSPDGRYIGTTGRCDDKASATIQLVDVRTRRLRTLRPVAGAFYVCPTWWR
jgi:hypothetical protein